MGRLTFWFLGACCLAIIVAVPYAAKNISATAPIAWINLSNAMKSTPQDVLKAQMEVQLRSVETGDLLEMKGGKLAVVLDNRSRYDQIFVFTIRYGPESSMERVSDLAGGVKRIVRAGNPEYDQLLQKFLREE